MESCDIAINWSARWRDMIAVVKAYGVRDESVIQAMASVPRHTFIPDGYLKGDAYDDHPCSIGYNQTISQPYIVAHMLELMSIESGDRVLEIGAGSGYQAAVMGAMGAEVYSVEIIPELAAHAQRVLAHLKCTNVKVIRGDGYAGLPDYAPYDVIIAACAPADIPKVLINQLSEKGRMILPVGEGTQRLIVVKEQDGELVIQPDLAVRFVPMVAEAEHL